MNEKLYNQESHTASAFSQKHVIGYMFCILLTALSLWGALYSAYTPKLLLYVLAAAAFSQAMIQLVHEQKRSAEQ
ncbi:hypothetical protein [Halobacillus sp. A5]|uniref:hypothetical protein n=1 Tax=Halobacillus sp. A5 TaxID=2880263 RepID=UPI0020A6821F|nr:hypothetical protein [Halobacillus sp. A5]MCP3027235.1 hypothetical protein [Halobacillus sp. A5]